MFFCNQLINSYFFPSPGIVPPIPSPSAPPPDPRPPLISPPASLFTLDADRTDPPAENDALGQARQQLARANAQLADAHAGIRAHTHEVRRSQQVLRRLTQQLEPPVEVHRSPLHPAPFAAEQQRATLTAVFDQAPAAVCLLRGPEHRFTYLNPSFQYLYPGHALWGRSVAQALPEAEAQGFTRLLDQVYQTGETYHGREMPLRDTGPQGPRERFFDFSYQAFRENGVVVGVAVCAFEVTEQVRVREQVAVAVFRGPRYVIELANPAVCTIWGRTADQVLGRPLFEALPEAAGQGFEELLDGVLATGVPYVAHELPSTLDRAGRRDIVYWNFVYQPLVDAQGQITGITVVASDVSEQVRSRRQLEQLGQELAVAYATLQVAHVDTELANAALSRSNRQLRATNDDLDNFVYAASHDLKLPVLNLAGLFEELRRGVTFIDPAEEAVLVPLFQQALQQLSTTLDDLSTLGQLQQADNALPEPVALAEVLTGIVQGLAPQVREVHARITMDFSACPIVSYSRASLCTILLNLLSNALKYADPARPARIHVSLGLDAGQPVLCVQDNGMGFDAIVHGAELCQLFRRFHPHIEGTGVGLYLVNRLVQLTGGRLEVASRVGEGSTFRVYLGESR